MCKRKKKKARQLVSPYTKLKSSACIISSTEMPSMTNYDNKENIVYYSIIDKLEEMDMTTIDSFRLCEGIEHQTRKITTLCATDDNLYINKKPFVERYMP